MAVGHVSYVEFFEEVKKPYTGATHGNKRLLADQIEIIGSSALSLYELFDEVEANLDDDIKHGGSKVKWKFNEDDKDNLLKSFRRDKGAANKAAAFHYFFLCNPNYNNYADTMNRALFSKPIHEVFGGKSFVILNSLGSGLIKSTI
jgi:hypothetical protein